MMNKCAYCNHNNICKYKEQYQEVLSKIVLDVPEPFTLVLNCKHYYTTSRSLNDYINNTASTSNTMTTPYTPGGPEIVY